MVESRSDPDADLFEEVDLFTDDAASESTAAPGTPTEGGATGNEAAAPAGDGCHLCDEGAGRHQCVSCERAACSAHFWTMYALCTACATEEEIQRVQGRRTGADWRDVLGIKWVE